MPTQLDDTSGDSLAELLRQLVEDASKVFRAEIDLYQTIARYRISQAGTGLVALAVGAILLLVGLIVLFVMVAIGIAVLIGPVAAGILVAILLGGAGFLLLRYGMMRVAVLFGDQEEQAALDRGERKA